MQIRGSSSGPLDPFITTSIRVLYLQLAFPSSIVSGRKSCSRCLPPWPLMQSCLYGPMARLEKEDADIKGSDASFCPKCCVVLLLACRACVSTSSEQKEKAAIYKTAEGGIWFRGCCRDNRAAACRHSVIRIGSKRRVQTLYSMADSAIHHPKVTSSCGNLN